MCLRVFTCCKSQLPNLTKITVSLLFSAVSLCLWAQSPKSNLANVHLTRGWATFGQVLAPGKARDAIQVEGLPTQTDVLCRWPDGTIKFASVSVFAPDEGEYDLYEETEPKELFFFEPLLPDCELILHSGGKRYSIQLPTDPQGTVLKSGQNLLNEEYYFFPETESGESLRGIMVTAQVSCYNVDNSGPGNGSGNQASVRWVVENTFNIPGQGAVHFEEILVRLGEDYVWQHSNVTQPYLTRFCININDGLQAAQVTPDLDDAFAVGALPKYMENVILNQVNYIDHSAQRFDILGEGDLNPYMPAHSGRPEIAPYPDWAARYLAHKNPQQLNYVLKHGDLSGSWPIHLRVGEESFGEVFGDIIWVDNFRRQYFWHSSRAQWEVEQGFRQRHEAIEGNLGETGRLTPDNAHQPSLAYIPWLLTADSYYAFEMLFWANYCVTSTWADTYYNPRGGTQVLLHSNEIRGIGWTLRNITDAAAYLPDNYPQKEYFARVVRNNLDWLDNHALTFHTPLGNLWVGRRLEDLWFPPYQHAAPWETNYSAWAVAHANKQGFVGGLAYLDRAARYQLDRFENPAYRFAAASYVDRIGESGVLYATWDQFYRENFGDGWGTPGFAGYYGVDARLMLLHALERGWEGAQEAYDYLIPFLVVEPAFWTEEGAQPDLAVRAGWAIERGY